MYTLFYEAIGLNLFLLRLLLVVKFRCESFENIARSVFALRRHLMHSLYLFYLNLSNNYAVSINIDELSKKTIEWAKSKRIESFLGIQLFFTLLYYEVEREKETLWKNIDNEVKAESRWNLNFVVSLCNWHLWQSLLHVRLPHIFFSSDSLLLLMRVDRVAIRNMG